jgi:hypothetical protein
MLELKRIGNKITNGCSIPIAEFSDDCTNDCKDKVILHANYGSKILQIYEANRNSMHICNVVEMCGRMEEVFKKFDNERFELQRKHQ